MDIKLFSKSISLKNTGFKIKFGSNPEIDWKIIFVVASIGAIIWTVMNALIFFRIDKGEVFVVERPATSSSNTLNVEELRSTIDYYQNKAIDFQEIIKSTSTSGIVDPSL